MPDMFMNHARNMAGPGTVAVNRPGSVLVVDCDPGVCRVIALVLQEVGCETRAAYDAESALELLDEFEPDLVVAEVRLPEASGSELASRIRDRALRDVKVVLMSAYPRPPVGAEDYFLQKPLRFDRLLDIARAATV